MFATIVHNSFHRLIWSKCWAIGCGRGQTIVDRHANDMRHKASIYILVADHPLSTLVSVSLATIKRLMINSLKPPIRTRARATLTRSSSLNFLHTSNSIYHQRSDLKLGLSPSVCPEVPMLVMVESRYPANEAALDSIHPVTKCDGQDGVLKWQNKLPLYPSK